MTEKQLELTVSRFKRWKAQAGRLESHRKMDIRERAKERSRVLANVLRLLGGI